MDMGDNLRMNFLILYCTENTPSSKLGEKRSRRLTTGKDRGTIILSAIKEGEPWTRAVAAIYRTEVEYSPVMAAENSGTGVCFI